ncbi:MAG TPA: MlaE family lipid ABC transporter permease subunit [Steroidobacter sp.]|nr:MlaE family lipid ABC transporter permease subunit [Steroidobacteraceae bacterium]HLS82236.1 MlaE family lipid ABC transporter permease subunit [Steroidobacter sp.]
MLLETTRASDGLTLRLLGEWRIENVAAIDAALRAITLAPAARVVVDSRGLESMDLCGAWLLKRRLGEAQAAGASVVFEGDPPEHFAFIEEMAAHPPAPLELRQGEASLLGVMAWLGRVSVDQVQRQRAALGFFGRIVVTGLGALGSVRRLRLASVARHVYETGIQAIPIVALIAFLISVIVAYLGAQQLRQFGAEIFTVDLVAVAVLRELGVLLTAIIVAGRSGSAFAAEIGVMRLNDEVDALKSMGVDYFEVLVLPRVIGLLIALPLLTIIADAMGLAGGALLSSTLLDISLSQFIPRVQDALAPTTFWAGLIKAPVFALLIALIGTYRGMQVRDSSRELGRLTTVAVVQSIFMVIFADAVFAVVFVELDF